MRKLQGGLEASLHRVGHPSFLVYFYTQAKPSYWSRTDRAQPVKPAAGGRSGELGSASAFPLQQAAAVVASWGGSRRGEAEERWRSRARGWPWSSSSASARLTASRLVGSFPPFSSSTHAQLAAACSDPIGCWRNPIMCKLVPGERIRKGDAE